MRLYLKDFFSLTHNCNSNRALNYIFNHVCVNYGCNLKEKLKINLNIKGCFAVLGMAFKCLKLAVKESITG